MTPSPAGRNDRLPPNEANGKTLGAQRESVARLPSLEHKAAAIESSLERFGEEVKKQGALLAAQQERLDGSLGRLGEAVEKQGALLAAQQEQLERLARPWYRRLLG